MSDPVEDRCLRTRGVAAAIILGVTALRILYLLFYCPYDLAPDEGHYWDWSRHLDWSYYSKGPLVAWIIRGGCELFGGLSVAANGTLMPAVRILAVLFGGSLLAAIYVLTWQAFRSDRLALAVMLGAMTLPAFALCSIIMTIDAPFLCCWGWALVAGRWAIDGKRWAWPLAGAIVALGILAKYTMGLWIISAALFIVFTPSQRKLLFKPGIYVLGITAALSAVPILYWNSQHDWVTFKHVAVQAGVAESKKATGFRWFGPLEYALGQAAVLLGFWFVLWVLALWRYRPWKGQDLGIRYIWWMSVPTFVVFGLSSLRASGQINWPVAAYIPGAILIGGWLREFLSGPRGPSRRLLGTVLKIFLALGILLSLLLHDFRAWTALIAPSLPPDTPQRPAVLREYDPMARLKGSRHLAGELDKLRKELNLEGHGDPVLAGYRWDQPGLMGFYCEGHPQVYTVGLILQTDRHSQYDFWHPNPVDDAQAFLGRTFLVVGGGDPRSLLAPAFESVGAPQEVVYTENGRAIARWYVTVCRGFKGFDPTRKPGDEAGH